MNHDLGSSQVAAQPQQAAEGASLQRLMQADAEKFHHSSSLSTRALAWRGTFSNGVLLARFSESFGSDAQPTSFTKAGSWSKLPHASFGSRGY